MRRRGTICAKDQNGTDYVVRLCSSASENRRQWRRFHASFELFPLASCAELSLSQMWTRRLAVPGKPGRHTRPKEKKGSSLSAVAHRSCPGNANRALPRIPLEFEADQWPIIVVPDERFRCESPLLGVPEDMATGNAHLSRNTGFRVLCGVFFFNHLPLLNYLHNAAPVL